MEIKEIPVSLKGAAGDYWKRKGEIESFFDYPLREDTFQKRIEDLHSRTYPRRELVTHLLSYNERFGASPQTINNIHTLQEEDTVVVIGGQQAGILTGPLYTIHKIISIIQLAKEQERHLGVRVIPVFWIAGEDHDIDEINHVHVMKNGKVKKTILPQEHVKKASASETHLDYERCLLWIESVFKTFHETNHTKNIIQFVKGCLFQSKTYTEFFAYMITELFKGTGLVLVDSGAAELRIEEIPFFKIMLERHTSIQEALLRQQEALQRQNYAPVITTKSNAVHLFINVEGERCLLEKEGEMFWCKGGEVTFTLEELQQIALETPELLSNNVVTRPLMQEYLFPTLAFIGGPGEVAYWAELQQVFHEVGFTMPPVVPRFNISYLERNIETDLQDVNLTIEHVFTRELESMKQAWLFEQVAEPIEEQFVKACDSVEQIHASLRELVSRINPSLSEFAEKNKKKIEEQLQLLERTLQKNIELKHEVGLNKFRRIEISLQPMGFLQERVWNIFYYLNEYGFEFIPELLQLSFQWNGTHKVVKL